MLSIPELIFILNAFCGIKDPKISHADKVHCIDFMSNCSVVKDGQISNKQLDRCKEEWAEFQNSQRYK